MKGTNYSKQAIKCNFENFRRSWLIIKSVRNLSRMFERYCINGLINLDIFFQQMNSRYFEIDENIVENTTR